MLCANAGEVYTPCFTGGWSWAVYESFALSVATTVSLMVDLRHNTATINSQTLSAKNTTEWFDFDTYVRRTHSSSETGVQSNTFFGANFRVAKMKRDISVQYSTAIQLISEISGSWAVSLTLGFIASLVYEDVAKRRGTHDRHAIGRREGISSEKDALVPSQLLVTENQRQKRHSGPANLAEAESEDNGSTAEVAEVLPGAVPGAD